MPLSQLVAQPSIQVLMDEGTIFLHPAPLPELPANDPILHGVIVLNLPRSRRIRSLSVRLVRLVNVCFPDFAYEYARNVQSEVSLSGEGDHRLMDFNKGVHSFAFTLVVPSSSAPYVRSPYGRVYYKIVATAKADGLIGTDLVAERDVHIIVNPSDDGETQDLDLRSEGFHEEIGPWGAIITSQHLTVGGFLHFDFFLPSPPRDMKILSAAAYIQTTYVIKSVEHPKQPEQTTKHKRRLFLIDDQRKPEYQTEYSEEDFASVSTGSTSASAAGAVNASSARIQEEGSPTPRLSSPTPSSSQANPPTPSSSAGRPFRRFSIPAPARRAGSHFLRPRSQTTSSSSASWPRSRPSSSSSSFDNSDNHNMPPMKIVPQGKGYQFSHLAGIPGDDIIRPSTVPGTITPIRITHQVTLEVRFERPLMDNQCSSGGGNQVGVLKVERPIVISSCCCMLESVLVPSYSAEPEPLSLPPSSSPHRSRSFGANGLNGSGGGSSGHGFPDVCACGRQNVSEGEERAQLAARLRRQQTWSGAAEYGSGGGEVAGRASVGGTGDPGRGGTYKALYRPVTLSPSRP